ncbi:Leucine-rich_repeat protein [Hexamita inflata]|uniref:Leucine-rich repeat protein n=1 Tax=Hexamita inflata TaxID=28002 RepID=A0AA86N8D6_9EUKA|nr:Leucine-rich repeat protein [Hexamita inflata]
MSIVLKELPGYTHDYTMVTSELLIKALETADSRKEYTEQDFGDIRTLNISGLNICTLSNLCDFALLTKLDVSNNALERLTGLDLLVSLEVLDASFNKLSTLEGVDKLIHLTDLSLNKNKISNMAPLLQLAQTFKDLTGIQTTSHPLQSLNLADNKVSDLTKSLEVLRGFKNLKILTLVNNPVAQQNIYRSQTISNLRSLTYLDFIVILKEERQKALDQFTTEINHIRDQETVDNQKTAKALTKCKQIRIDCVSDCLNFDQIVQNELLEGEANQKIFLVPAVRNEAMSSFVPVVQNLFKNLGKILRRRRCLRQGEVSEFEEFYEFVVADLQGQQTQLIQEYYQIKEETWDTALKILNNELSPSVFGIEDEKEISQNEPEPLNQELLEPHEDRAEEEIHEHDRELGEQDVEQQNEMLLSVQPEEVHRPRTRPILPPNVLKSGTTQAVDLKLKVTDMTTIKEMVLQKCKHIVMQNLLRVKQSMLVFEADTQFEIQESVDQLNLILTQLYNKTIEIGQQYLTQIREQMNIFQQTTIDLLQKAVDKKLKKDAEAIEPEKAVQEQLIGDNAEFTTQGQSTSVNQQQAQQEIQNLLPAEMTPQVNALLKDRDSARMAAVQAHEYKANIIDQRDDALTASQKDYVDQVIKIITGSEAERCRKRIIEIEEWVKAELEFIEKIE